MPNWVTNNIIINAPAQKVEEIMNFVRRDGDVYGSFDFNKLIPRPEGLDLTSGSITDDAISAYSSFVRAKDPFITKKATKTDLAAVSLIVAEDRLSSVNTYMAKKDIIATAKRYNLSSDDLIALGKKYVDNQKEHGAPTWYEWSIKNWGTKWSLQEGNVLVNDCELSFDTAWSAPLPIVAALSKKFPDVEFLHMWADEDIGQNVGRLTFLNGEVIDEHIPVGGSKEAYEFAFDVLHLDPQLLCLRFDIKSGTYIYDETMSEKHQAGPSSLDNIIDLAMAKTEIGKSDTKEQPGRESPER